MPIESPGDVFAALASGRPDLLIGTIENEWVDFKRDPYPLHDSRSKWELCKDIAALANSGGGLIVLGIETQPRPNELADEVVGSPGIPRERVVPDQYRQVIGEGVRPRIDVALHWFPVAPPADEEPSFFVIEVRALPERTGLAIVGKMPVEEGRLARAFGIPKRAGAATVWLTIDEIHGLIRDGFRAHVLVPEATLAGFLNEDVNQRAHRRIEQIEQWHEWESVPTYFVQAIPPRPVDFTDVLFEPDGIRGILEADVTLRSGGWNLRTDHNSEIHDGALAYLRDGRRAIVIDANGLATVGAIATEDYLAWAQRAPGPNSPRVLHPLSVTEFTLESMLFFYRALMHEDQSPPWRLRVTCRRFLQGRGVAIRSGPHGSPSWYFSGERSATSDVWEQDVQASGNPERDAFAIMKRVFLLFGHDSSAVPYAHDGHISSEEIRAL